MPPTSVKLLYPLRDHMGPLSVALPRLWNPDRGRHILPELSLEGFAGRLNERNIPYVVLNLGQDDLEVLVCGDAEMDRLDDLVNDWPMGRPVRIYTVSPRHRTAYYSPLADRATCNRIAVFPPYISEQLLERAVSDRHGVKVLTASDALLACAYRAAYMEAACCDWQNADLRCGTCTAYVARLRALASTAGAALPEPLTPPSLDQWLNEQGWRPPLDLLEKAVRWAPWIREAFPQLECEDEESRTPGLSVFFLRDLAFQNGWKSEILATLAENGFELLLVKDLDDEQRAMAARCFRGGDWGAVNLRVSGGPPAGIIVGLDLMPRPVSAQVGAHHPDSDNMNIRTAKDMARALIKAHVPKDEAYNPLHSTDNSHQAWNVIRLMLPDEEQDLRAKARELRGAFSMNGVVRNLASYSGRSKADVIHFNGAQAVRKVFPPSAMRYMQREIEVMEELGPLCPEIPRLLERGPNFLVVEHVDGEIAAPKWPRPLPFGAMRQLAAFVKKCAAEGFDPVGLKPRKNVVLTNHGIRVVKFEFWRRCDRGTLPENCAALAGLPQDDRGDRPAGVSSGAKLWARQWFPDTALSMHSFLYDPAWLQRVKRAKNLVPRYARWFAGRLGRRLLRLARSLRKSVVPKKLRPLLRLSNRR
jgi:hypothetical protein